MLAFGDLARASAVRFTSIDRSTFLHSVALQFVSTSLRLALSRRRAAAALFSEQSVAPSSPKYLSAGASGRLSRQRASSLASRTPETREAGRQTRRIAPPAPTHLASYGTRRLRRDSAMASRTTWPGLRLLRRALCLVDDDPRPRGSAARPDRV